MVKPREIIAEKFVNAFLDNEKAMYADEVWDILVSSYSSIGGLKGAGFESKQAMINNIPFWKLVKKNGNIVAVAMYKDKNGRKRVAIGSDGTELGKLALQEIIKADFARAYVELSGKSLSFMIKTVGIEFVKSYIKTVEEVQQLSKDPVFDPTDTFLMNKFPTLVPYMYDRHLANGEAVTKIMVGTSGNKIIISQ